jgi:hypothetical protein
MDITLQQFESPANIIDFLDFPDYPPMNLTGNEALWLALVCQLG